MAVVETGIEFVAIAARIEMPPIALPFERFAAVVGLRGLIHLRG